MQQGNNKEIKILRKLKVGKYNIKLDYSGGKLGRNKWDNGGRGSGDKEDNNYNNNNNGGGDNDIGENNGEDEWGGEDRGVGL